MSTLLQALSQTLGGGTAERLSDEIGADPEATQRAVAAAIPVLLGALQRNVRQPGGADALASALGRDHDGSLLDQLGGLGSLLGGGGGRAGSPAPSSGGGGLGGLLESVLDPGRSTPKSQDGGGILDHIFGRRRSQVEEGIGKASGLDAAKVGKLLMVLAPLVMAFLGRQKRQRDLDSGGLRDLIEGETRQIERETDLGGRRQGGGGLLESILDRDGDGQVIDDVAEIGGALARGGVLGSIFGRR